MHLHIDIILSCCISPRLYVLIYLTCSCIFVTLILIHVLSFHIIDLHCVLFTLIYVACMVKSLLNQCLCQINPNIMASCKAERSWVPNTFPRTYLSSKPTPRLVPLWMDSNFVPTPKNQVATPFLCPSF